MVNFWFDVILTLGGHVNYVSSEVNKQDRSELNEFNQTAGTSHARYPRNRRVFLDQNCKMQDPQDVTHLASRLGSLQMSELLERKDPEGSGLVSKRNDYDTPVKAKRMPYVSKIPKFSPTSCISAGSSSESPRSKEYQSGTPSKLPVMTKQAASANISDLRSQKCMSDISVANSLKKSGPTAGLSRMNSSKSSWSLKALGDNQMGSQIQRTPGRGKENIFEKLSSDAKSKRKPSYEVIKLRNPKVRVADRHAIQAQTIGSSTIPRSRTLQSLNSLTKETKTRIHSENTKPRPLTLKRKAPAHPHISKEPRIASVSEGSGNYKVQITSYTDLFQKLRNHRLTQESMRRFRKISDRKPEATQGIKPELLSSNKLPMYDLLTVHERGEILRKEQVYYVGRDKNIKVQDFNGGQFSKNFGFDDENKDYIIKPGDHLDYRYEIISKLGKGCFGSVISCADHKTGKLVAVKIIKNNMDWMLQSINEIKTLKQMTQADPNDQVPVLKILDSFQFRSHMCIVTDLLAVNLYQAIEASDFSGFSLPLVQKIGKDVIDALGFVHAQNIIHCDLKPENVMLIPYENDLQVRLIDFGSSCPKNQLSYSYLQSRFYRAPEVALGSRYSVKIDIWSFGAMLAELYTGLPLFPATNEFDLIAMFGEHLGPPPKALILKLREIMFRQGPIGVRDLGSGILDKTTLLWRGFNSDGSIDSALFREKMNRKFHLSSKTVESSLALLKTRNGRIGTNDKLFGPFVECLRGCFQWDPFKRVSATQLVANPFFTQV
ncbi:unnamed protein product [Kuraishia capsulata CBS 1993]|uniref:Protein kinase domain-containing protein n=1 Tax=Kuraishia capsulata CBS 1993 TaxID=1382522 RepID=W6MHV0_9ASCO|nr:uncharacterized protein KUCA_T00001895001 [Kuraishia capsulata CBS 1993]CDK25924.1 unnamed protein product [Kuraishia capsulata CBS 1993]